MHARLAVKSRVFPLFNYDPAREGVFGKRFSLDGNPNPNELWNQEEEETMTPVDWAVQEQRFAPYFSPLQSDDPSPLAIAEYLKLDTSARRKKTPFVTSNMSDSSSVNSSEPTHLRLKVEPALVAASEECLQTWRTLQELAGLVTPFTTEVEAKLKQELTDGHQAELAALKQEYEARIENIIENMRAEMETEMATHVKNQLMGLAGYRH